MEDHEIIELYFARENGAIAETQTKYGGRLRSLAKNILHNEQDAEECENDTYIGAWNTIPPTQPKCFFAFWGKITRNLALKRFRHETREKRGGGEYVLALDELSYGLATNDRTEQPVETEELGKAVDVFLRGLSVTERTIFLRRYWYFDPVTVIAKRYGFSESKVKMTLKRTREKLLQYLKKEGWME